MVNQLAELSLSIYVLPFYGFLVSCFDLNLSIVLKQFPLQFQFFHSRAVSEVCYTYLLYINLPVDHSILTCGKGRRVVQCRFGPSSTIWIDSSPSLMTEPTSWSQKIIFSWFKMLDWVRPSYATCPSRVKRC